MLMIMTILPVTGALNVQPSKNERETLQSTPASPGLIGIRFVARVHSVDDPNNLLGGVIKTNDTISGKYVYDSGIPDSDPDTTVGHYPFTSYSCRFEVYAGGLTFKNSPSNMDFSIWVYNNHFGDSDEFSVLSLNNLQLDNGMLVNIIQWDITDFNGTALDSDILPTTAPVLSEWELNSLLLIGKDPSDPAKTYGIQANVTKATKNIAIDGKGTEINKATPLIVPYSLHFLFQAFWERLFARLPQLFTILHHH